MSSGLEWQDRFNIGVEVVDKAHKQLFATMNRLLGVSEHKVKSRWVCEEGIKYLRSHTMKHFAEEEEYMKSIGYSGYERHRRIHRTFRLTTLPALEKELEDTNYSVDAVRHFLGVCIGWMTGHTLTEDQAITGRIPSKWDELLPDENIAALEKTITRTMREMFMLDARVINENYRGEDFGKGIYYRMVSESPEGERRETIFILENELLTGTVGAMLGVSFDKVDDVVINATRYIARQFLKRVKSCFVSGAQQEIVEESLMTAEEFREVFEKINPECSILFGTETGYFVFCSFKAPAQEAGTGRTINAKNAMDEIKKYLDTEVKKKIMVVDDSNAVRMGIKKLLEKDYKVTMMNSGPAAVKAVSVERPDLILLDLEMPDCDGIQTLKMLRTEGKMTDIPVIFLTGRVDQQSVEKIMSVKPAGYMLKTMRTVDIKKNIDSFFVGK
ncbi:MAG: response regulator [Lachnospiraceae bacterium]|nr:response regulator [Lachnospiraceae bacterium]